MLDSTHQNTEGNFSPIVNGDGNILDFGNRDKLVNEVNTMLRVITLIPEIARERGISTDETEYPKDFLKKINERFALFEKQLKAKFTELHVLYQNSYEEAERNAGIDEFGFEEMCSYLRSLSLETLLANNNDPIKSLKILCGYFEEKFGKGADKSFSAGAIEYFLYKQLIECNVFPNPSKN